MTARPLAVALALCSPLSAAAQSWFPTDSALRTTLTTLVGQGRAAGIVVGLLDADGSRRVVALGSPGADGLPLDGESVFEIGSITKVFTGTLLADMVRTGEVALTDSLSVLLPGGDVRIPARHGKAILLVDITTHHSGLPRMPNNFRPADPTNPYADYSVQQMYAFVSGYQLPRDPGDSAEYSNFAMGLLGHALARQAGTSYEEVVRARVLLPLGMTRTGIVLTPWMRQHLAHGHDAMGDPAANWDIPTLAGAGALRSTANDMLRFAAANLAAADTGLDASLHTAQRALRRFNGADSIGFNWLVSRPGARAITWHNGGTGGYRTFIGLDRAAGRAVVVLTNSGGGGLDDLGFHLLDPGVPLARPPVGPAVTRVYREQGVTAAIAHYRTLRATEPDGWRFGEAELNTLGYWLLGKGRPDDAIAVFRLNVEMFPAAFNPYDSLGKAYLARGDTALAIQNYRRSVELNPNNAGGVEALRKLGARPI